MKRALRFTLATLISMGMTFQTVLPAFAQEGEEIVEQEQNQENNTEGNKTEENQSTTEEEQVVEGSASEEAKNEKTEVVEEAASEEADLTESLNEERIDASGSCGDSVSYTFNSDTSTLTIKGTGNMANYSSGGSVPWNSIKTDITSVVIEEGVTSIGDRSFMGCSNLTGITIPDSITKYGTNSFHSCTSLAALNIGANVNSIGQIGIYLDTNMTTLTVNANNSNYASVNNWLYELDNNSMTATLWQVPAGVIKSVESVPDSITWNGNTYAVTAVGKTDSDSYTFGSSTLTSITLGSNVVTIGRAAFKSSAITSIDLSNVTTIGVSAFSNCKSLESVQFSESLKVVPDACFSGCVSLTHINIPNSLTTIGKTAFDSVPFNAFKVGKNVTSIGSSAITNYQVIDMSEATNYDFTSLWAGDTNGTQFILYGSSEEFCKKAYGNDSNDSTNGGTKYFSDYNVRGNMVLASTEGGTFESDTEFSNTELATPVKEGYIFDGWYEDLTYTTPQTGDLVTTPFNSYSQNSYKIYYAKWIEGGKVNVALMDEDTGKALAGATFKVYDSDGNPVGEAVTDENGTITFQLRSGNYTVVEQEAPEGYILDDTSYEIFISEGQNVKLSLSNEEDKYNATIKNSEDIKDVVGITDDEQKAGTDVWLVINDISSTISDADKSLIDSKLSDNKVGLYLDVSLYKKVGSNASEKITETPQMVEISFELPDGMYKEGREFEIIRVHGDEVEIIECTYDKDTNTITFETNQFSTYALVYKDPQEKTSNNTITDNGNSNKTEEKQTTKNSSNNKTDSAKSSSSSTAEYTFLMEYITLAAASIGMMVLLVIKRRMARND